MAGAAAAAPGGAGGAGGAEEERLCRYCFEGGSAGELVAPCACRGGQKWVHLSCLRRWQRMALVSQPTHPAHWEDSPRHRECGVCKTAFTCPPPSRHELMESFTGPEIAAMIAEGCVIASHERFSQQLQEQIDGIGGFAAPFLSQGMRDLLEEVVMERHWVRGVYLIVKVEEDEGVTRETIERAAHLRLLREQLGSSLSLRLQGDTFRLQAEGSLAGAPASGEGLAQAFAELEPPVDLVFRTRQPGEPRNFSNDHVVAVNLARPVNLDRPDRDLDRPGARKQGLPGASEMSRLVMAEAAQAEAKVPDILERVNLEHYMGGPCHDNMIQWCVVPGAGGHGQPGWVATPELSKALLLSHSRQSGPARDKDRKSGCGELVAGEGVRVAGLQKRPELNGEVGVAQKWLRGARRWTVRLQSGLGVKVRPEHLEGWGGRERGTVMVFWGDARWSRTQLLGEIARGHWGMCKANVKDVLSAAEDRMQGLKERLVFAPETEYTEESMRGAQREMEALQRGAAEVEQSVRTGEAEEEDGLLMEDDATGGGGSAGETGDGGAGSLEPSNVPGRAGGAGEGGGTACATPDDGAEPRTEGSDGGSSPRVGSRRPRP